ncbi:MAG: hypothetical protein BM556_05720 [Bacteriovorax sp. MedPE-SWde]|nr:MAG: hypothetical protein BM556_05720 [Bacteriovorax sp. MedPE-SWde]
MKKTKEEAQKTKNIIVKGAIELFSKVGIESCTLQQIANEVGCTRGAIYWHFKNKEELISFLIDEYKTREARKFEELSSRSDSNVELLIQYGVWSLEKEHQDPLGAKVEKILSHNIQSLLKIGVNYNVDEDILFIASTVEKAIKSNEMKTDLNSQDISYMYLSYIYGMSLMAYSEDKEKYCEKYDNYLRTFFKNFCN